MTIPDIYCNEKSGSGNLQPSGRADLTGFPKPVRSHKVRLTFSPRGLYLMYASLTLSRLRYWACAAALLQPPAPLPAPGRRHVPGAAGDRRPGADHPAVYPLGGRPGDSRPADRDAGLVGAGAAGLDPAQGGADLQAGAVVGDRFARGGL